MSNALIKDGALIWKMRLMIIYFTIETKFQNIIIIVRDYLPKNGVEFFFWMLRHELLNFAKAYKGTKKLCYKDNYLENNGNACLR